MFKGHKFVKLVNQDWVLDITEFVGYKVESMNGKVKSYTKAFSVIQQDNEFKYIKFMQIPAKVLKEANIVLSDYINKLS